MIAKQEQTIRRVRPVIAALAGLALVCLGTGGCHSNEKEAAHLVPVEVAPVVESPIAEIITTDAIVSPLQQAAIMPRITSTIKKFYVQRGSRVKKGQLLAVLENSDLSAAEEQSKGEWEQAQASYATTTQAGLPQEIQKAELDEKAAKAALDAQQKVYDNRKALFEEGAVPRRELDSAQVALVQARGQWEVSEKALTDLRRLGEREAMKSAGGQLVAARGKYQGASAQLSYSEIRSPMDGVVTDRPQYEGELATPAQPILTVMDTSRLIAKAHIGQFEAAALKRGNAVEITIPGIEQSLAGKVTLVSPALDAGSTTIEIWAEANHPVEALKPGITVHLAITGHSAKEALVVPTSAVYQKDDGTSFVVLAGGDNHAHVTDVKAGIRTPQLTQITEGVKKGDLVITTGGYALPDQTQIKIETAKQGTNGTAPDAAKDKE